MRRTLLFAAALLSSCGESDGQEPESCDLETAVVTAADGEPALDCGSVALADTLAAWQTARACALDALSGAQSFRLVWEEDSLDGLTQRAVVMPLVADDGALELVGFFRETDGRSRAGSNRCESVIIREDCDVSVGDMCLDCVAAGEWVEICG